MTYSSTVPMINITAMLVPFSDCSKVVFFQKLVLLHLNINSICQRLASRKAGNYL